MMQLKTYLLTLTCALFLFQANAQLQLSKESEVSILTIGPGFVLNDAFGHSAIRIKDPLQNIDLIFDYGRYDFQAKGFYLNFAKGKLDYEIGWTYSEDFISNYKLQQRRVTAQIINLTLKEKQNLFEGLQTNIQPQNKSYSYDFFYNNCATKIKDVLVDTSNKNISFLTPESFEQLSFRELIRSHVPQNSWGGLGIDAALGSVIDRLASVEEHLFLPKYLDEILKHSKFDPEATKLVLRSEVLNQTQKSKPSTFWWSPLVILGLVSITIIGMTYYDWTSKSRNKFLDALLFFTTGSIGILILFLWFATDHTATAYNYNFLWAFGFNLLMLPTVLKPKPKKRFVGYLKFLILLLTLMLLHSLTGVQAFNYTIIPLWIALLIRYGFLIHWFSQKKNQKNI
ncbi:MAG: hypothetical protein CMC77_03825 [Flavobacteriaceae bacterium]|nr:hypothetical protein [Flavobacteriaceae bacterium]